MGYGEGSEIREAEQRLVRYLAYLSDSLYAGREQGFRDASRKADLADRSVVGELWCRL